jgi:hypothetical protein
MMARSFSSSPFLNAGLDAEPDADPRVGLVNLADVMLVFACGLMLALVAYWNLDISEMQEVIQADEVTEVQDVEDITDSAQSGGGFVELGKVYQDPMTGKYYMLQKDKEQTAPDENGEAPTQPQGTPPQEAQTPDAQTPEAPPPEAAAPEQAAQEAEGKQTEQNDE